MIFFSALIRVRNFWHVILMSANFFQNQIFQNSFFQEIPSVSKKLNPDQAGHFVGPDLGPNCLQRLIISR